MAKFSIIFLSFQNKFVATSYLFWEAVRNQVKKYNLRNMYTYTLN